jgi:uncharacterized protein (TIGR03435 family)
MKRTYLALLLCCVVFGQAQPQRLAFEVASVKPTAPGTPLEQFERQFIRMDASRVSLGSITLGQLIQMAYRVRQYQVVGPDSLQDHFDIEAKLPSGSSPDDISEMMQTLLAERFKLVIHHERKVVPAYALVVGKDGPKFHESKPDDSQVTGCKAGRPKICHKETMEMLADDLSLVARRGDERLNPWAIDRPVIDMTGLKGAYDFTMDYGPARGVAPEDVVTALEAVKSLGLKLEPTTHTDEIIVVDHIERAPTAN